MNSERSINPFSSKKYNTAPEYGASGDSRNHLPKPIIISASIVLAILIGVGIYFAFFRDMGQSLENQEEVMEYAGENSRVSGIQFLSVECGLTFEQYTAAYKTMTETFNKVNPDAKYFSFVSESLSYEESEKQKNVELTETERAEIMAKVAASGDHTATIYYDDGTDESYDEKSEETGDVIVFKMAANSGEEYTIKVTPNTDMKSASTEILNSAGEKIN